MDDRSPHLQAFISFASAIDSNGGPSQFATSHVADEAANHHFANDRRQNVLSHGRPS
jgi:hypothetical protein